jgi:2-keto-4-pentenoate hydratase/2-oxohepta-3-ene-1,7-dioic acid hydratase in catechol pathway
MSDFEIRNFWCVGRNYRDHAIELNNPVPSKPLIFLKSGACEQVGPQILLSPHCQDVHHELEIVLLLNKELKPSHWTLGLDLTDRKTQSELKSKGEPWELCKSFKGSAVLGPWQKLHKMQDIENREFKLEINEVPKQIGNTKDMIFPFGGLLNYLQTHFPLSENDAVFTGTPAGVGPLVAGDRVKAQSGELTVTWTVR